jgi:signal peptidase I
MKVHPRSLLYLLMVGFYTRVQAVLGGSMIPSSLQINAVSELTVTIQLGSGSLGNGDYFVLDNITPGKFSADSLCTLIQPSTTKVVI